MSARPTPRQRSLASITHVKPTLQDASTLFSSTPTRSTIARQRYFVLVQYGPELDVAVSSRDGNGLGGAMRRGDVKGGSVLSFLQPTAHLQLVHLLPQLHLPSPLGLSLHLHIASTDATPRIDESIWNHFFSRYLLATANATVGDGVFGGLPIAAHLVLRVDKDRARWWASWRVDPLEGRLEKWVDVGMRHAAEVGIGKEAVEEAKVGDDAEEVPSACRTPTRSPSVGRERTERLEPLNTSVGVEQISAREVDAVLASPPEVVADNKPAGPLFKTSPDRAGLRKGSKSTEPFFAHPRLVTKRAISSRWTPTPTLISTERALPLPPSFIHAPASSSTPSSHKSRRTSLKVSVPVSQARQVSPSVEDDPLLDHQAADGRSPVEPSLCASPTQLEEDLISPGSSISTHTESAYEHEAQTDLDHSPQSVYSEREEQLLEDDSDGTMMYLNELSESRRDGTLVEDPTAANRLKPSSGVWPFFVPFVTDSAMSHSPEHPSSPLTPTTAISSAGNLASASTDTFVPRHTSTASAPVVPTSSMPILAPPASGLPAMQGEEQTLYDPKAPGISETNSQQVSRSVAAIKARQDISILAASEKLALKSTLSLRRPSARPRVLEIPREPRPITQVDGQRLGAYEGSANREEMLDMEEVDEMPQVQAQKIDKHASLFTGTSFDESLSLEPFSSARALPEMQSTANSSSSSAPFARVGLPPRASRMDSQSSDLGLAPASRASIILRPTMAPSSTPIDPRTLPIPESFPPMGSNTSLRSAASGSTTQAKDKSGSSSVKDSPNGSPKRPIKRISQSLGFFSEGDVDLRPPLNYPHGDRFEKKDAGFATHEWRTVGGAGGMCRVMGEQRVLMAEAMMKGLNLSGSGYPNLIIYPPVFPKSKTQEQPWAEISRETTPRPIRIGVHCNVYPILELYQPVAAKPHLDTQALSDGPTVTVIRPLDVTISVFRAVYPDIELYAPSASRLANARMPTLPEASAPSGSTTDLCEAMPPPASVPTSVDILVHSSTYPQLVIYAPKTQRMSTSAEGSECAMPVGDVPMLLQSFNYPSISLYPDQPTSSPPTQPELKVRATTIASYQYPDLVIYPSVRMKTTGGRGESRAISAIDSPDPIVLDESATIRAETTQMPLPSPVDISVADNRYPLLEIYKRISEPSPRRVEKDSEEDGENSPEGSLATTSPLDHTTPEATSEIPTQQTEAQMPPNPLEQPFALRQSAAARSSPPNRRSPPRFIPPPKPIPNMALPPTPPPERALVNSQPGSFHRSPSPGSQSLRIASPDSPETQETDSAMDAGTSSPAVAVEEVKAMMPSHRRSRSSTLIAERTRALMAQASPSPTPPIVRRGRSGMIVKPPPEAVSFPLPPTRSGTPNSSPRF